MAHRRRSAVAARTPHRCAKPRARSERRLPHPPEFSAVAERALATRTEAWTHSHSNPLSARSSRSLNCPASDSAQPTAPRSCLSPVSERLATDAGRREYPAWSPLKGPRAPPSHGTISTCRRSSHSRPSSVPGSSRTRSVGNARTRSRNAIPGLTQAACIGCCEIWRSRPASASAPP